MNTVLPLAWAMRASVACPFAALLLLSACGAGAGTSVIAAATTQATTAAPSISGPTAASTAAPTGAPSTPAPASPAATTLSTPVATAAATTAPTAQPTAAPATPAPATPPPATPTPATPTPATPTPATPAPGTSRSVAVTLTDNAIKLGQSSAPAGAITFTITNSGYVAHELVVLQTSIPQDQLPLELANPKIVQQPGYVGMAGNIAANTVATLTLTLAAGPYVLICNLPNHYKDGMHVGFTVTAP